MDSNRDKHELFIKHLPHTWTNDNLVEFFKHFGAFTARPAVSIVSWESLSFESYRTHFDRTICRQEVVQLPPLRISPLHYQPPIDLKS
jgi:hypothetical protein